MGEVIDLAGQLAWLEDNQEFISDCCRYAENIASEESIRKKWRFDNATWEALGSSSALIEAIELEKVRRIRSGQMKREMAQKLVVKVPEVAASIAFDSNANPRHRLDAGQLLDKLSANGPEGRPPASDRFQITIVLNSDVERYDKSIAPNPLDIDPNHPDDTPMMAAIAAKKPTDDGNGNAL